MNYELRDTPPELHVPAYKVLLLVRESSTVLAAFVNTDTGGYFKCTRIKMRVIISTEEGNLFFILSQMRK